MEKIKAYLRRPQVWGFFVSVVVMAVLSLAFFYPDNFEGNVLNQPDMQQGAANGQEGAAYEAATGEKALWTNSLFGGMPTFQISPSYPSNSLFTWLNTVYGLGLPAPSNLLFMMMFGFLILLFTMKMRWYYALIGAVAWGFSSYFIIIIGAGHIWKFLALTYVPPTIAGLLLLYRGRYIGGAAMLGLFAMLQLNANHPQMTYYFGLVMVLLAAAYLIDAIRRHEMKRWLAASALALGAGALALGANLPSLYNTYEYAKQTTRASSELHAEAPAAADGTEAERPTGGMPKEQIVGWSYDRAEMFTLVVPNFKGGASARPEGGVMVPTSLAELEGAEQLAQQAPLVQYMSQYFNDSEGTNGPVYVGVLVVALFLVGICIVRGPLKWWLLASTVLSVVLALGRNAEGITDFMIYNFPLYNKFRAVESILVIAEFTMPLLAIVTLERIVDAGREAWTKWKKPLLYSFGLTAMVCVFAIIAPGAFGDAITDNDRATSESIQKQIAEMGRAQGATPEQISAYAFEYSIENVKNRSAAESLRYGMARADGLRSLMFLLAAAAVLGFMMGGRLSRRWAVAAVGVLILCDLYSVDKRYVSHASFIPSATPDGSVAFTPDEIDRAILADTSAHYRVLDIPGFYTADRSYFHKTLGGYHAAKLGRYDDIIKERLAPVAQIGYYDGDPILDDPAVADVASRLRSGYRVADMLNARYVITGDEAQPLVRNYNALGNAWLVDDIRWVDGARQEMDALDAATLDFGRTAVADRSFAAMLPEAPSLAPGDTVYLTSYSPNRLTYHVSTAHGGVAVFSEVWFPWGWKADIDGKEAPIVRADYILRALAVPAGSHTVTMTFDPASLHVTSGIAYGCVTLIYLIVAGALFAAVTGIQGPAKPKEGC